jgi:hypothetical protein
MTGRADLALWLVLSVLGASAVARVVPALSSMDAPERRPVSDASLVVPLDRAALTLVTDSAVARAPFRFGTGRALLRFGETPPEPRPVDAGILYPDVRVSAIVGGPPWQAVLQGVPGFPTDVVVRRGDRLVDLSIGAITGTSVRLVSPDTSWLATLPTRDVP